MYSLQLDALTCVSFKRESAFSTLFTTDSVICVCDVYNPINTQTYFAQQVGLITHIFPTFSPVHVSVHVVCVCVCVCAAVNRGSVCVCAAVNRGSVCVCVQL